MKYSKILYIYISISILCNYRLYCYKQNYKHTVQTNVGTYMIFYELFYNNIEEDGRTLDYSENIIDLVLYVLNIFKR